MSELDGFTSDLKHKVGPLPAWQWGTLAAIGIVLVMHFRKTRAVVVAPNAGSVSDPSAEASGITPTYDASMDSLLHNSEYGSAGGQSIPVPLDQTQFDVMLHDYLVGNGYTQGEASAAIPTTVPIASNDAVVTAPGASTSVGMVALPSSLVPQPAVESPIYVAPTPTYVPTPVVARAPLVPAFSSGFATIPGGALPKRSAATDQSITSIPESLWTARQRAYADMYGLSGSRVFA